MQRTKISHRLSTFCIRLELRFVLFFFLILFDLISLFLAYESAPHLPILVKYIIDEKLTKNNLQLMIAFLKKLGPRPLDIKELEAESGIGKFQFFLNSLE